MIRTLRKAKTERLFIPKTSMRLLSLPLSSMTPAFIVTQAGMKYTATEPNQIHDMISPALLIIILP